MNTVPCAACPWRASNAGKRTEWGFYTLKNRRRLWNEVRSGGQRQSCHPTDPSHPDHRAAGAKPGATVQECAGSVILILRELRHLQSIAGEGREIQGPHCDRYLRERRHGITRNGLMYWLVMRAAGFARGTPMGEPALPDVEDDPTIVHP